MTEQTLSFFQPVNHLFMVLPDTELARYFLKADKLVQREPEILEKIRRDQDTHGKEKKRLRLLDKEWTARQNNPLPGMQIKKRIPTAEELILGKGRERMDPMTAYIFLMGRGYYGGIKSEVGRTLMGESKTMHLFLENKGLKMPSENTVYDNINVISNETRTFILDAQIRMAIDEQLDDFKTLIADSTSVEGNVSWPKDSNLISQLLSRIFRRGKEVSRFGMKALKTRYFPRLIRAIDRLSKKINMESGKRDSQKKRRKYYQKLLKLCLETMTMFDEEMGSIFKSLQSVDIIPTHHAQLSRLMEMIHEDMKNVRSVWAYCYKRVIDEKATPSKEKIMSISDSDAAYIEKGNREAKIGYKPQLARSKQGFITNLIVPKGNAADSAQFNPIVEQSISRTKIIPDVISVDDGYVNKAERNHFLEKGVKIVSFSGAKGKCVISQEDWESQEYIDARNDRSAVESLMYTIKYKFDFDRVMRRGVKNVEAELLEKVIAYNFCRMIQIRKEKKMPFLLAA